MSSLITPLIWIAAIGSGLMAGTYFAFSAFVMAAFARAAPTAGIEAMRAINATILGSAFMPLFFGTTLIAAALAIMAAFRWGEPGSGILMAAGLVYLVGMFLVTVVFNVPLNNRLVAADPASVERLWRSYLATWTPWNHVRTGTSTLASGLYVAALVARH